MGSVGVGEGVILETTESIINRPATRLPSGFPVAMGRYTSCKLHAHVALANMVKLVGVSKIGVVLVARTMPRIRKRCHTESQALLHNALVITLPHSSPERPCRIQMRFSFFL